MLIRASASPEADGKSERPAGPHFPKLGTSRLIALFLALAILLVCRPASAEQMIAKVVVNQEDKGDLFVERTENGDFLLKSEDLRAIGFRFAPGQITRLGGEEYRSLRSMSGVSFTFNEGTLTLSLTVPLSLLGKEIVDFVAPQPQKVYYPEDSSVFLNYGADYLADGGLSTSTFNLTNQLGARSGKLLFLSDGVYTSDRTRDRFVRLQTSLTYDDRSTLRRFIAGDFFANSGDLGSNINIGGIGVRKVYQMDPYYIYYPTLALAGQVATPSEAKVYLNGILLKTQQFSPGEFELKNLTPYGTAGTVEVVLKDAFGREQRLSYPFYFGGPSLLKKGLQEYSYQVGFLRDQFGNLSGRYSKPVFSAQHRFGVSDSLTLGYRAEAGEGLVSLGPQAQFLLDRAGLFTVALGGSTGDRSKSGLAGTLGYSYQGLKVGASLTLSEYTRDYSNLSTSPSLAPKTLAGATLSWSDRELGSLSLGYSITRMYLGTDSNIASVGYSRTLPKGFSLTATYRNVRQAETGNEFFVALNYTPKAELSVSASYQSVQGSSSEVLEVQKNTPVGEGYGYRVDVSHADSLGQQNTTVDPSFQYNGRYGIYQAEINGQDNAGHLTEQYHLSASGALVYLGGNFGATRPVYDSFGLVKMGNLEGVRVLLNSQEVGKTDGTGKLFVPELGSFYQNQVTVDTTQLSVDYYLSSVGKVVSPPLRSGSCIPFVALKLQPITGTLMLRKGKVLKPVEYQEITLEIRGKKVTVPTGSGGIFDLDLSQSEEFKKVIDAGESGCASVGVQSMKFVPPGAYRGTMEYEGKRLGFTVVIPESREEVIDLGTIVVEAAQTGEASVGPK